jgi:hypothetical protein
VLEGTLQVGAREEDREQTTTRLHVCFSSGHIDEPGGATVCIKWPCRGWQEFGRPLFRRCFVQGNLGCTYWHLGSGLSTLRRYIGINSGPTIITAGHRGSVRTTL